MRCVACEKQTAVTHRFEHVAAQRRDALFEGRPARHVGGGFGSKTDGEFIPQPVVAPVFDTLGQRDVDIIAAASLGSHRRERKTAFVVGVNQFVMARRNIGQNPEPTERVNPLELRCRARWNAFARWSVIAVATCDESRVNPVLGSVFGVSDKRRIAFDVMQRDIRGLVYHFKPARRCRIHQVAGHLGLPVHRHMLARQRVSINPDKALTIGQRETFLQHTLGIQPRVNAKPVEQVGRGPLQHTCANAAQNIIGRCSFDDDAVDAFGPQQMAEQQPRWPRTNDGDLVSVQDLAPFSIID